MNMTDGSGLGLVRYLSGHDALSLRNQIALDTEAIFEAAVSLVSF